MITSVKLRNWKSHLDTELSFQKGVNVLVGLMGTGKSSVLEGIAFGLFGTFPVLQSKKVTLDDLIMKKPQLRNSAEVEVGFLAGGKEYTVKRSIFRGKSSQAELREEGVVREVSQKGVTEEVSRLLEMDYDLFSKAVYSEQNSLDYFLKIPKGQRRTHIDRMLHVDRYELARVEAVGLQNNLKAGKEEKARIVRDMEDEGLDEAVENVEKEIAVIASTIGDLETSGISVEKERKKLEKKVKEMEEKSKDIELAKRRLEGLKGGLEEIREREGKCRKIVRGKDLGELNSEIKQLDEGIETSRNEMDFMKEDIHASFANQRVSKEDLDKIEHFEGKCPLCESGISEAKKESLVKIRKILINELEEGIAKKHEEISFKEKEIRGMEDLFSEKQLEKERASQAFREIKELEEKLREILTSKERYESVLKEEVVDVSELRDKLQEAAGREREIAVEIREKKQRLEDKEDVLETAKERVELLDSYRKELAEDERINEQLGAFGQALKATQEQLRKEFLKNVNLILERVWEELYPYDDLESVRLEIEDGDYLLQVKAGEWMDVEAASGGERSLASLALRIAFSLAFLPNLRWLILDEPTHNLDSQAIAAFSQVLREKLPQFAEQAFLITHDPSLSEGLDNVQLLERDKSRGEATRLAS